MKTHLEFSRQGLSALPAVPVLSRLPGTIPTERRDQPRRAALLRRIFREFEELPGLTMTLPQAARLFGIAPDVTLRILDRLVDARVLQHRRDGQFALRFGP
jgi:hypothetical protein